MGELLKYFKKDYLAAEVWSNKYSQKGDVTPDDMHLRMAKNFARVDYMYQLTEPSKESGLKTHEDTLKKLSSYGQTRERLTEESIYELFKDFKYVIPQGSIMSQLGAKSIGSLSNCFVIGTPEDSYGGIFKKDEEMAQLMKRRGGVGLDISTLRPKDTAVSNAAKTTTGAVSFMHRYSNTTREVAQNGRRGALMLSIDINHPDVMDFIKIKRDGTSVTGANISIKINNDFMKAVENDEDYILKFPCNLQTPLLDENLEYNILTNYSDIGYVKRIKAKEDWEEIIKSAHGYAEPGIIFEDNHHNYSPDGVYPQFKGVTTNPSLRYNTLIQTDLGLFPIKELAEKDGLTIVKNVLNEWQVGKVFMSGKDKDLYKITFTNGYEVFCTAEHKWVVLNSTKNIFNKNSGKVIKKRTDELMFGHPKLGGDRIPLPFKPEYEGNVSCKYTVDDGFILGYWLGDGWSSMTEREVYQHSFIVSEKELECCGDRIKQIFNKNSTSKSTFNQDHNSKAYVLNSSSEDFRTYFEQFIDTNDKSKGIPNKVFKFGKDALKGFIDGLFSSDGSVWANEDLVHSRITLTTSREMIAKDVQKILNLFGISSRICFSDKNGFNRFDLVISGIQARKFGQTFNLTSKYKQESLNEILSFDNTYKDNREYLVIKSVENTGIKEDVYDITVHDDTHTFMGEFGVTGNCGEIFMQPYDACRLIALNYYSFIDNPFTKDATFNSKKFYEVAYEAMRLSDNLIDLEIEHIDRIISKLNSDKEHENVKRTEIELWTKIRETAKASRRTGLGFTALGDALAALNYKYDSEEALLFIEQVSYLKMEAELDCTIDMAILRGTFDGWDSKLEFTDDGLGNYIGNNDYYKMLIKEFPTQVERMIKYGRRNVSFSTVAPTGTVNKLAA